MEAPSSMQDAAAQPTPTLAETLASYERLHTALKNVRNGRQRYRIPDNDDDNGDDKHVSLRVLGQVSIITRDYPCDPESQEEEEENDDKDSDGKDADIQKAAQAGAHDVQSLDSHFENALAQLGKRKRNDDKTSDVPIPRGASLERVTDGALAAASLALRDIALQRSFTCGGRIDLAKLPALVGSKKGVEANIGLEVQSIDGSAWYDAGTLGCPKIDVLLAHSVSSPFGDLRTGDTVIDESVRLAREIPPERLRLVCAKRDVGMIGWRDTTLVKAVCDAAISGLIPGHACEMRLHKLNIYGPGGFFHSHVDTPRDRLMVGTAVIGLPSSYTGGQLVVRHSGSSFTHEFATTTAAAAVELSSSDTTDKLTPVATWAALYGDCLHEVKPVASGYRVTLAFDLLRREATTKSSDRGYDTRREPRFTIARNYIDLDDLRAAQICFQRSSTSDGHMRELNERLAKATQAYCSAADAGEKPPLGIVLSHRYAGTEPDMVCLKGADRAVADIIGAMRHLQVVPVLVHRHVMTNDYGFDPERSACVVAFSPADLRHMLDPRAHAPPPPIVAHAFIDMVDGRVLSSKYDHGSEYTGNEAAPHTSDCVYFSVALLIGEPLGDKAP